MRDIWNGDAVTRVAAELFHVAVTHEPAFTGGEVLALRANKEPYGSVEYADPGYQSDGVKRYPLDTEKHVRAALSYFGQPDTIAQAVPVLEKFMQIVPTLPEPQKTQLAPDVEAAKQLIEAAKQAAPTGYKSEKAIADEKAAAEAKTKAEAAKAKKKN